VSTDGGDAGDPFAPEGAEIRRVSGADAPPRPRSHRRRPRWLRLVVTAGSLLILLVALVALWYEVNEHAFGPEGKQVVIIVRNGESTSQVIDDLSNHHVIASTTAFRFSDIIGGAFTVSPGGYALRQNETYGAIKSVFAAAPNVFPVTVDPGYTLSEVAARVGSVPGHSQAAFERTAASGMVRSAFEPAGTTNLEGMLGAGNYIVVPGETDTQILQKMVTAFDQQATSAGLSTASASALGFTPYEVITAASIVEKEGYIKKNMPDVARVIYNRLASNTALQMDSTVLYAIGQDGGPVTPQDEQIQSPYNTYLNRGLTPTPICIPSETALSSAVHPPPGSWLYFELVEKDGTEAFATTYAEQLANEQLAHSRGLG
jgi:UPF0755 protein